MFAGASLDENSGAFCELKANFFRLILTKAELMALTPADFDFDKNKLSIKKSYQRISGRDVITKPKTPKSVRMISMPENVALEMKDFLDSIYGIEPSDRIFVISKSYLHHEMDRGVKASGVKRIRLHDLRHSHVSLLIDMGFSAVAIGNRVGHESSDITYRYAHMMPSIQDDMVLFCKLNDAPVVTLNDAITV